MSLTRDMELWNKIAAGVLVIALSACATGRSARLQSFYKDDIASNRESIRFGSPSQAIGDLTMMLEMDPKNTEARFLRAVAFQKSGDFPKAAEDYNIILKNNFDHAKSHHNLAMIYAFKLGKKGEALKHFDAFITLAPEDSNVSQAAKTMLSLDREFASNDPADINQLIKDVLADQGLIRAKNEDDTRKRRKMILDAIRASPASAGLHFAMAKSYEQDGKIDEAIKYYKDALELRPACRECHSSLGQLLIRINRKEEAQIHLLKASLFQAP